jgi:hypothetical protein
MNHKYNENVTLNLCNIHLDIYESLFRRLQQEGFSPPVGSRRWQKRKIVFTKESVKQQSYATIEIEGSFPGGQQIFDNRVNQLSDEIVPREIKYSFIVSGISKNKILTELSKKGVAFKDISEQNDEVSIIISYPDGDVMPLKWLCYAIRDSIETATDAVDIEICDIE